MPARGAGRRWALEARKAVMLSMSWRCICMSTTSVWAPGSRESGKESEKNWLNAAAGGPGCRSSGYLGGAAARGWPEKTSCACGTPVGRRRPTGAPDARSLRLCAFAWGYPLSNVVPRSRRDASGRRAPSLLRIAGSRSHAKAQSTPRTNGSCVPLCVEVGSVQREVPDSIWTCPFPLAEN
jgi:hypothetical protein